MACDEVILKLKELHVREEWIEWMEWRAVDLDVYGMSEVEMEWETVDVDFEMEWKTIEYETCKMECECSN